MTNSVAKFEQSKQKNEKWGKCVKNYGANLQKLWGKVVKTMGQMRQKLWGKSAKGKCFIAIWAGEGFSENENLG